MSDTTTKQELIETLKAERANLEALLERVGPDRMEARGITGIWSAKDIIAHITAWDSRVVETLRAVSSANRPKPPDWPSHLDEDAINAWIFAANRARPVQDVLEDWCLVSDTLRQRLDLITEEDLLECGRFEWLGGESLHSAVSGNTFEHYREHAQEIGEWLAQRETP